MITGFIIGKFYPLHLGHQYLIDVAQSQCDRLIVWICDRAQLDVPGTVRAAWIHELYPAVDVRVVPDTLPDDDSAAWAAYTVRVLGRAPDVVFSSEDYGTRYAALMGSRHVMIDRFRKHVAVSGTEIRRDVSAHWDFLSAPVRAFYAKRVTIIGAESTGTTTLTAALAKEYHTTWVAEYGREYTARKMARGDRAWSSEEFVHIAEEQRRREDDAARHANRIVFCDTDAFATTIWHQRYIGSSSSAVQAIANTRRPDLYLLTGDEIPFVDDGLRDGEHIRHDMQRSFVSLLAASPVPYAVVSGNPENRLRTARALVDRLLAA